MKRIVVCAGGTGGHVFPAIALCDQLAKEGYDPLLLTDKRGSRFCNNNTNLKYQIMPSISVKLKNLPSTFINALKIIVGLSSAWKTHKPEVVIGFGGASTFLPLLIAKYRKIKTMVHEPNIIMGKANRILAKICDNVSSNFPNKNKNIDCVPTPVRTEIANKFCSSYEAMRGGKLLILITGGSQGAEVFSSIIPASFELVPKSDRKKVRIVQQASEKDKPTIIETYKTLGVDAEIVPFIQDMASVLDLACLVICRSGASTLSELATVGRPAILVPYPHAAADHQLKNAEYYDNLGAAWLIPESKLTPRILAAKIQSFIHTPDLLTMTAINMVKTRKKNDDQSLCKHVINIISKTSQPMEA